MQRAVQPEQVRLPQSRGVYRAVVRVRGRHPYYAIRSDGTLFDMRRARHHETDAQVVVDLWNDLDEVDPETPRLSLVVATPAVASSSRPAFWMPGLLPRPSRDPRRSTSGPARGR